jgi:hypothetical protein
MKMSFEGGGGRRKREISGKIVRSQDGEKIWGEGREREKGFNWGAAKVQVREKIRKEEKNGPRKKR